MSGMPLKTPTDASKFRQNYLANLALEAKNNDTNLQANKVFKKTGQTPSQPTDFRNTSEKLADIERLKIDVRSELKEIADGEQANAIVNELNPEELTFLAQHIQEIVKDIKPKYKYGVLANIFIPYLLAYMDRAAETNEVSYGLQQSTGQNILLGIQQIQNDMINADTLNQVKDEINRATTMMSGQLHTAISRNIEDLAQTIPSADTIQRINSLGNAILRQQLQEQLNEALRDLPTNAQIVTLMRNFEAALARRDAQNVQVIGAQLNELLAVAPQTRQQMQQILRELQDARVENRAAHTQTQQSLLQFKQELDRTVKSELTRMRLANSAANVTNRDAILAAINENAQAIYDSRVDVQQAVQQILDNVIEAGAVTSNNIEDVVTHAVAGLRQEVVGINPILQRRTQIQAAYQTSDSFPNIQAIQTYISNNVHFISPMTGAAYIQSILGGANQTRANMNRVVEAFNGELRMAGWGEANPAGVGKGLTYGARIKGNGLKQTIRSSADYSKGIMPQKKYVPFGRYFIDQHRLNDDIVALKRGNGCNVFGTPVERVGKEMGHVLRSIVGGGQPQFHHLEKLSSEEKEYLHKLAKITQIGNRIAVPTPNKDDDERDINEFEIAKGQILSGNDSAELVKKFKILIMKMVKKDLLPKNQAKEILMELVSLGY